MTGFGTPTIMYWVNYTVKHSKRDRCQVIIATLYAYLLEYDWTWQESDGSQPAYEWSVTFLLPELTQCSVPPHQVSVQSNSSLSFPTLSYFQLSLPPFLWKLHHKLAWCVFLLHFIAWIWLDGTSQLVARHLSRWFWWMKKAAKCRCHCVA